MKKNIEDLYHSEEPLKIAKPVAKRRHHIGGITGKSEVCERVRCLVLNYAIVEEPVLLKGETGVGKNHIAELIHRCSGRSGQFVVVHTPSISENLFESEVFGHRKGSFTDAKFDRKGLAAEADGGTLFFDEISEIPLSFQTKILRFIETKKYRVLGESSERQADVRIVTATNKDLLEAIENSVFREDLYFRINVLEIEIPPLRLRKDDIRALVMENRHFLKGNPPGEGFWEAVLDYNWPGNIRELFTVLKRAGIMINGPITGADIEAIMQQGIYKKSFEEKNSRAEAVWEKMREGLSFWDVVWPLFKDREVDRYFVKGILKRAFMLSANNFKDMLGILNVSESDYQKFMSLMYKYRFDPRN